MYLCRMNVGEPGGDYPEHQVRRYYIATARFMSDNDTLTKTFHCDIKMLPRPDDEDLPIPGWVNPEN